MKKQFLRSMLLACMLVIMLLPTVALAEGEPHHACGQNCDHHAYDPHRDDSINWQPWEEDDSLPASAGAYYLTADVTLSSTWDVPVVGGGVTLCLNGHSITKTTITVASGGSLIITDCGANVRQGYIDANYLWNAGETVPVGATKCDLKGGIINSDKSGYYVGECVVSIEGGVFTLYGGNLSGSKCEPVSVASNGTFTMYGGNITGNGKQGVNNSGTFTMNGGTISNNGQRGVFVLGNGTFTMNGGTISNNQSTGYGGGVRVSSGTFTMNGGTITNNKTTDYGGGVYVDSNGTFTMNGGTITNNQTTRSSGSGDGGGVYVENGTFTMNDGNITGNTTGRFGGGVYVKNGTFTMNGGTITYNKATSNGGGVYVTGGEFNMEKGDITKNSVSGSDKSGGGVYVTDGEFNMKAGNITDNTAQNGSAVSAAYSSTFNMSGGSITQNPVTGNNTNNCAVCAYGTIKLSGNCTIFGNKASNDVEKNLFVPNGKTITIAGELDSNAKIGVTTQTKPTSSTSINLTGNTANINNYKNYFKSDDPAYYVDVNGNVLQLKAAPTSAINLEGATNGTFTVKVGGSTPTSEATTATAGATVTITATPDKSYEVESITVTKVSDDTTVPVSDDGTFIMPDCPVTVSVTFKSSIVPVTGVSLDETNIALTVGNTKTLIATVEPAAATNKAVTWSSSDNTVAAVDSNGKVTAVAPGTATITATAADGSGVSAACTVTVNAVTYTITKADAENGTVTVNKTTAAEGEEVTITATAAEGYEVDTVTYTPVGGSATVVQSTEGVYSFTMPADNVNVNVTFKAVVTHANHCVCNGNAVGKGEHTACNTQTWTAWDQTTYLPSSGTYYLTEDVTLSATHTVTGNLTLCLNGHDITPADGFTGRAVSVSGTLNLTDCGTIGAITGFETASAGAGVYVNGTFIMYDGTISNNKETQGWGGGGVYVRYDGTFAMYGGTISGNTTSGSGGGVAGTVTMTGGRIADNTAKGGVSSSVDGSLNISGKPEISGDVYLGSSGIITITGPLALPQGYETISVYSSNKNKQHVAITAGASEYGVITTDGAQSIFVPKDTVNTRFHVHNGEVCQESKPTVTFDVKGGSPTPDTQTLSFDEGKATAPTETLTKTGCEFSHWCDNEFCTNYTNCSNWSFDTVITESKTLYAIWEPFSVTVTSEPGKLTAVASPATTEDLAYQWYKVIESDTGFTVTPEFLANGNGFARYKCVYSDLKWTTNDEDYFNRRFMIYMNSGDTLTATFDADPGSMFLYGCNLFTFTNGEYQDDSDTYTYVFTAPTGTNGETTRDIYVLLFFDAESAPNMSAVYKGSAFEAVEDQDQTPETLDTTGLPSGQYVCKVTWAEPTTENYAGIYALSEPVSYMAPANYTVTADPTEHGTVATDPDTAAEGETVTITATPNEGYVVNTITVTKTASGDPVAVNNNKFTMPAANVTVTVTFREIVYTGTVSEEDGAMDNVTADGLGEVAEEINKNIVLTVKVEAADANDTEQTAIKGQAGSRTLEFLDITLKDDGGNSVEVPQSAVLEIAIPFTVGNKQNITVYRHHNGTAAAFTALNTKPAADARTDATFYVDSANNCIYIYTNQFSTYAIGYTVPSPAPSGGSYTPTYAIAVEKSENGEVKTNRSYASGGSMVTLTVIPDTGYALETLRVTDKNGKEVELTNKGDGKYTFKMPASKVTVEATFMDDNTMLNFFVDVPADAYYYDAVLWAVEKGITKGTSTTTFSPDNPCTRAQMVTFLWRAAGSPEPRSLSCPFVDVDAYSYYGKAVLWAVENGITNGTSDVAFSPDMECSRAQMTTFLCRMANGKAYGSAHVFADVDADAYYAESVRWAVENGITEGIGNSLFGPDATCTRAQMVTFLYRYYVK